MYCWTITHTPVFFCWKLGFLLRVSFLCERVLSAEILIFTRGMFFEIQYSDSWCSGSTCTSFFFLVYSVPYRASPMMHCYQGGKYSIQSWNSSRMKDPESRVLELRYLWFLLKQFEFCFSPETLKYRKKKCHLGKAIIGDLDYLGNSLPK